MKSSVKCLDCIVTQGNKVAEMVTNDFKLRKIINEELNKYIDKLNSQPLSDSPAILSTPIYYLIRELTGVADPFKQSKLIQNKNALLLYPDMIKLVYNSNNPLHTAAKISVIGNIIDCGINASITKLENELEEEIKLDFAIDDFNIFEEKLKTAKDLLFITDNAGEIVFDKLFIQIIKNYFPNLKIYVAVKSGPILNDATIEDASMIKLDEFSEIVTTGSDYIGIPFEYVSEDFKSLMEKVDIIISKGQGNYETLDNTLSKIFFLLKAKCPVIAEDIDVPVGSLIFKKSDKQKNSFR